jgi:hypothetical protein
MARRAKPNTTAKKSEKAAQESKVLVAKSKKKPLRKPLS